MSDHLDRAADTLSAISALITLLDPEPDGDD